MDRSSCKSSIILYSPTSLVITTTILSNYTNRSVHLAFWLRKAGRAMVRSGSCPARLRFDEDGPPSRPVSYDITQLSNSNNAGGDSPRALAKLISIRSTILNTLIWWMPVMTVSAFQGFVYGIVWWNPSSPDGSPLPGVLRAAYWHTTLMKATTSLSGGLLAAELARVSAVLQTVLVGLLRPHRNINGDLRSWLDLPPWRGSWCFGVPTSLRFCCEPLRMICEELWRSTDRSVRIRKPRLHHISWN